MVKKSCSMNKKYQTILQKSKAYIQRNTRIVQHIFKKVPPIKKYYQSFNKKYKVI